MSGCPVRAAFRYANFSRTAGRRKIALINLVDCAGGLSGVREGLQSVAFSFALTHNDTAFFGGRRCGLRERSADLAAILRASRIGRLPSRSRRLAKHVRRGPHRAHRVAHARTVQRLVPLARRPSCRREGVDRPARCQACKRRSSEIFVSPRPSDCSAATTSLSLLNPANVSEKFACSAAPTSSRCVCSCCSR